VYLHKSAASPEPRSDGVFCSGFGFLEYLIEMMGRPSGRRIRRSDAPWLHYYVGKPGLIGTGIYQRIAQEEHLQLRNSPQAGLIHEWRAAMGRSSVSVFGRSGIHEIVESRPDRWRVRNFPPAGQPLNAEQPA